MARKQVLITSAQQYDYSRGLWVCGVDILERRHNMKKIFLCKLSLVLLAGTLLFSPSILNAITISDLAPGYFVSDSFMFSFETPAIAFDANQNLYTVDKTDFSGAPSNTIDILKLDAATGYSTSSVYATYSGFGISGLEFDDQGNLYVAEFIRDGVFLDRGRISKIDDTSLTQSTIADLPDYRPTGITLDEDGNIYFPGRLESDLDFGNLYKIDSGLGMPEVLVSDFVGTGIAIDASGDMFASTSSVSVAGQESRVIYTFDLDTLARSLFARSFPTVEELTFDWEGIDLYVLEVTDFTPDGSNPPEMITISPVPEPAAMLLIGAGLLSLVVFSRRLSKKA